MAHYFLIMVEQLEVRPKKIETICMKSIGDDINPHFIR